MKMEVNYTVEKQKISAYHCVWKRNYFLKRLLSAPFPNSEVVIEFPKSPRREPTPRGCPKKIVNGEEDVRGLSNPQTSMGRIFGSDKGSRCNS